MAINEQELGKAMQGFAENLHQIDVTLAKLRDGLSAVKAVLAIQMNPNDPKQALERISENRRDVFAARPSRRSAEEIFRSD